MKVIVTEVGGLNLLVASLKKLRNDNSDSESEAYQRVREDDELCPERKTRIITHSNMNIGEFDRKFIAKGMHANAPEVHRLIGLLHLDCTITASPSWFKRSGVSYYVISQNEDGTLTAATSITFFRLWGLYNDAELVDIPEWDEFFNQVQEVPYFDLCVSEDSREYEYFDN